MAPLFVCVCVSRDAKGGCKGEEGGQQIPAGRIPPLPSKTQKLGQDLHGSCLLEFKPGKERRVCPPGALLSSQSIAGPPQSIQLQSLRNIGVTTQYRGFWGNMADPRAER